MNVTMPKRGVLPRRHRGTWSERRRGLPAPARGRACEPDLDVALALFAVAAAVEAPVLVRPAGRAGVPLAEVFGGAALVARCADRTPAGAVGRAAPPFADVVGRCARLPLAISSSRCVSQHVLSYADAVQPHCLIVSHCAIVGAGQSIGCPLTLKRRARICSSVVNDTVSAGGRGWTTRIQNSMPGSTMMSTRAVLHVSPPNSAGNCAHRSQPVPH